MRGLGVGFPAQGARLRSRGPRCHRRGLGSVHHAPLCSRGLGWDGGLRKVAFIYAAPIDTPIRPGGHGRSVPAWDLARSAARSWWRLGLPTDRSPETRSSRRENDGWAGPGVGDSQTSTRRDGQLLHLGRGQNFGASIMSPVT
ncbi:PREDICTED: uncharacterized protein LOC108521461 [Rhinopithecus bieti]|uniref:uncharacterized protein LOC108521461 n=1 Tax=Rhinopithecus bieti TaxID=61621 RepID=UPI00083C3901|nr:PREDICTED: uncharacterized protein LOC108521461 [Rhinopithecus bieti]